MKRFSYGERDYAFGQAMLTLRTLRRDRPYERLDISGVKGLTEAQKASLQALGVVEKREGLLKA